MFGRRRKTEKTEVRVLFECFGGPNDGDTAVQVLRESMVVHDDPRTRPWFVITRVADDSPAGEHILVHVRVKYDPDARETP